MATTLDQITPQSRLSGANARYWDYSSVASISRNLLECCILFFYLGVEDPPEDEWRARTDLMHLHDAEARVSLWRELLLDNTMADGIALQRDEVVERLRANPFVQAMSEKQQRHLLRGEAMRFEIQDDVLARMSVNIPQFRAWYRVLSAHTHSYSLAFHRVLMDERGRGVENEPDKAWIATTLEYVSAFLSRATTQMLALFPDVQDPRLAPGPMARPAQTEGWAILRKPTAPFCPPPRIYLRSFHKTARSGRPATSSL